MYRRCVLTPFLGRLDQLERLLGQLLPQCPPDTAILLINDGGPVEAVEQGLAQYMESSQVHLLHHESNQGVAAARNTGIAWCRAQRVELLLMVDSDCQVGDDFVSGHLALHEQHPEAACFGGGVVGQGRSIWAKLDGLVSWVHSMPLGESHEVPGLYHLPTTNFSLKMQAVADLDPVFDARLNTGEDALLIRYLRAAGRQVWFAPRPAIRHQDRERFLDVVSHHYAWGHHQYFVQLGQDLSPRVFQLWYRGLFVLLFLPLMPFYALAGAGLNLLPWLRNKPASLLAFPAIYLLWLAKSCAVIEAALRPQHCLRVQPSGDRLPA